MKKLLYILLFVPLALFGQENYSMYFDGVDAGVNLGNSSFYQINESDTMAKTVMFWAKDDWSNGVRRNFMTKGACGSSDCMDIHFWYNVSESTIQFATGSSEDACSEGAASYSLSDNWNFFSMTINANSTSSGEKKLYLNGELLFSCNYVYNATSTDDNLYVGFSSSTNLNQIQPIKYIDNLSIWDRVLTEEEINYFMRTNVVGDEIQLLGAWDFNEGIGNIALDISGNGNNGDVFGASFYSDDYPKTGCMDINAVNYNSAANIDDGSCISQEEYLIDSLQTELLSINDEATNAVSSLQQALETWNTTIDLSAGWNMFGYGCPNPIDVVEGLSNHTESINIVKDNDGSVYMPEFSFNGIGDFTPGFGYQIKVSEAIEGFSLCDWYVNDIPEDNIVSLQDSLELINSQIGCADFLACNFDITHLYDDGSCVHPEQGFDCEGNIIEYLVGIEAEGGIVFYIDETGEHGLVAALEDIEGTYEWGCYGTEVNGADGQAIGTGYTNTLDIVSGCSETPIAASEALVYEAEGYDDWYLPSRQEIELMYGTIGSGGPEGNIGDFSSSVYWASSEFSNNYGWNVFFGNGGTPTTSKSYPGRVRVIRSF